MGQEHTVYFSAQCVSTDFVFRVTDVQTGLLSLFSRRTGCSNRTTEIRLMIPTYWWNARPNFGDLLTRPLLAHFCDAEVEWAPPDCAELVCIGSNLDALPCGWDGVVLGAGKLWEDTRLDLGDATVLGVRGELTAKGLRGDFVLGDPGLLADELVPRPEPVHNLGIVAHWTDPDLHERFCEWGPLRIDVEQDPLDVIRQIGSCKKIVSSSLHGIVVADAYGIPRRIEPITRQGEGGSFKFRDYSSAIKFPLHFGVTETPPRANIERVQYELFDMLTEFWKMVDCV